MKRTVPLIILAVFISILAACTPGGGDKYTYRDVEGGVGLYRYKGSSLKDTVTVPDEYQGKKVVALMDFSVANAEYVKTVKIGAHVRTITPWALANCKLLEEIEVDEANPWFESDEYGVLYTKGKAELVCYPNARAKLTTGAGGDITGGGTYEIPAGVAKIRNNAFYLCGNLFNITFNEGLLEIGDAAFMKCASLQNFTLPESLVSIGTDSFSFCDALTAVTIPGKVEKIGDFAFYSKASLIKQIVVKKPVEAMACGKDWLPYLKTPANVKAEAVYIP